MDDQRQAGKVDTACGDVGRDADTRTAVAQRLERMVALVLRMLTRQRHRRKAALDQAGVQMADIVAGGAEQDRNLRLVQAQQVDHRRLDIGGGHGHRLIGDVGMALVLADRLDPLGIGLIPLGELHDRARHGRREEERATLGRRAVEDLLQVFAEAHVEHLVRFVENDELQRRQVERTALQMVAQTARRADDDMRAMAERPALARGVHAADAGGDTRTRPGIEPFQLAADLQRQFAGRRDDQRHRRARLGQVVATVQQLARHGQAESDGLARTGLGGHDQVAALGVILDNGGLDGGRRGIATRGKGSRQDRRQGRKRHGDSNRKRSAYRRTKGPIPLGWRIHPCDTGEYWRSVKAWPYTRLH